jgi:hypothetical protein
MTDRVRLAGLLLVLALAGAVGNAAVAAPETSPPEGAEIRDLQVRNSPTDLFVSFRLYGGFTPEIREQIHSGLPVTFRHYVEIVKHRAAWFDDTLVKKKISTTVTYDTLTRQYRLTRDVNEEMVETTVTDRPEEMELFMSSVERQRLCDPSELPGDRRLALRVKSRIRRRFVFFFIPWNLETSWARIGLSLQGPPESPPAGSLP